MKEDRLPLLLTVMREAATNARDFTEGMSFEDFRKDKRTEQAVAMSFVIIGESVVKAFLYVPNLETKYPQIAWVEMRGMRNHIAHSYNEIEFAVVWDTLKNELPKLIANIDDIFKSGIQKNLNVRKAQCARDPRNLYCFFLLSNPAK